jgi:hypothetical protein
MYEYVIGLIFILIISQQTLDMIEFELASTDRTAIEFPNVKDPAVDFYFYPKNSTSRGSINARRFYNFCNLPHGNKPKEKASSIVSDMKKCMPNRCAGSSAAPSSSIQWACCVTSGEVSKLTATLRKCWILLKRFETQKTTFALIVFDLCDPIKDSLA